MEDSKTNKVSLKKIINFIKIVVILGVALLLVYFILPPANFPNNSTLTIERGTPLGVVSYKLKKEGYIHSRFLFEGLIVLRQNEKSIQEGEYYFERPINLILVALRLTGSDFGLNRIKVTIPEGYNRTEIANRCEALLANCNAQSFLDKTKGLEGQLFPDTYLIFPSKNEDELLNKMSLNFTNKTKTIFNGVSSTEQKNTLIMASILEREANGAEDVKIISGILKNRLKIGMPLQVDATFYYLLGKESSELTRADLKIKSPYNTYINKGLPPEPISNPGLRSIEAALYPTKTDYLYYLHDKNGVAHYAKTYTEHIKNKNLYLK